MLAAPSWPRWPLFGRLGNGSAGTTLLADERSRFVKASLSRDHELIYPPIQAFWDAALKGTG
jgi:hypothetical protein